MLLGAPARNTRGRSGMPFRSMFTRSLTALICSPRRKWVRSVKKRQNSSQAFSDRGLLRLTGLPRLTQSHTSAAAIFIIVVVAP